MGTKFQGHECVCCHNRHGHWVTGCERCGSTRLFSVDMAPGQYCAQFGHVFSETAMSSSKRILKRERRDHGTSQLVSIRFQLLCGRCGLAKYDRRELEELAS